MNGQRPSRAENRASWQATTPDSKKLNQQWQPGAPGEIEDEERGATPKALPKPDALPKPARLPPPAKTPPPKAAPKVAPEPEPEKEDLLPDESMRSEVKREKTCCDCACLGDKRAIDEILTDTFVRPVVNWIFKFFSQPINVSLFLYYFVGLIAFRYLEKWTFFESAYFLTVTATTVGYGDFHPETPLGKIFTSFFCLYGLTVVLAALAPIVDFLHGDWREAVMKAFGAGAKVDTKNLKLSMAEVNARINYTRRYILACLSPGIVAVFGACLYYFTIRIPSPPEDFVYGIDTAGCVDGIYWAMITMTTIGYGDIHPETFRARCLAMIFIPVGVMALADALADIQMIGLRRQIRETDFGKLADECLLRDATRDEEADEPNLDPELSEAEFIVDQLISNGLVDGDAIVAIRRQFAHLTRNQEISKDEDRKLTPRLVYEEIRNRIAKGEPVSRGAEVVDVMMVDPTVSEALRGAHAKPTFKWKSFHEWKYMSWQVRVKAKHADKKQVKDDRLTDQDKIDVNINQFRMMG